MKVSEEEERKGNLGRTTVDSPLFSHFLARSLTRFCDNNIVPGSVGGREGKFPGICENHQNEGNSNSDQHYDINTTDIFQQHRPKKNPTNRPIGLC